MSVTPAEPITVAAAAATLAVSERTVWRYLKSGRLVGQTNGEPGLQRMLISGESLARLVNERRGGDMTAVRAEQDRLARRLRELECERDALRGRVASLQSALAGQRRPAWIERMLGGAWAAVARVRVS